MSDPFREQRFTPSDVRRIVQRAAELADGDPATAAVERSLTREELERVTTELGLPASSVAAAAHGGDEDGDEPDDHAEKLGMGALFLGAPTRRVLERTVAGEPTDADREDVVEDIRGVLVDNGSITSVGKTFIWRLDPGYRGRGRDFSARLRARHGRTHIVLEENLGRQAVGLFVGLGVGGGIGPMGAYIAVIAKLGVLGLVFPLVWIPLMLLLARSIFVGIARRRDRTLEKVMRRIEKSAASWTAPATKARVANPPTARVDTGDDDADVEAETEASVARARR